MKMIQKIRWRLYIWARLLPIKFIHLQIRLGRFINTIKYGPQDTARKIAHVDQLMQPKRDEFRRKLQEIDERTKLTPRLQDYEWPDV